MFPGYLVKICWYVSSDIANRLTDNQSNKINQRDENRICATGEGNTCFIVSKTVDDGENND